MITKNSALKKQFSTLVFAFNLLDSQICRNVRQLEEYYSASFFTIATMHLVKQTSKVPLLNPQSKCFRNLEWKRRDILKIHSTLT